MDGVSFNIKLAGTVIKVCCMHQSTKRFCDGYLTDERPDIEVCVRQADIDRERIRNDNDSNSSDGYLETLAVYRTISEQMPFRDTFLFHGSAIAVDGKAYLFTAKSGTGKSTHAALWRRYLGDRAVMVNDDKPLIRITDDQAIVYGTPWNGKHHLGTNIGVPLKAVCLLTRSEKNVICAIGKQESYVKLVQQVYRPYDPETLALTMDLLDKLSCRVNLYKLGCNMDLEAAEVAYKAMNGEEG